jgi:hypothetical protein
MTGERHEQTGHLFEPGIIDPATQGELDNGLSPEEAEAHRLLDLAFFLRFPDSGEGGLVFDTGISIGRVDEGYPEPTRFLHEVVRDRETKGLRYQRYQFRSDGTLVPWSMHGQNSTPVSADIAEQLRKKLIEGREIIPDDEIESFLRSDIPVRTL